MRDLLIRTGRALYGEQWQTPLAADLGVTDRTIRRWKAGDPIPDGIRADLLAVVKARRDELADLEKALT